MDREELAKLGAVPKSLHVLYSVKAWGDGKTVGGDFGMEVDLSPEADPEQAGIAVYEYAKQVAHKAMSEDLASVAKPAEHEVPKATGDLTAHIIKFTLEKRVDKKLHLKLYPDIKGKPGEWPELQFVAEREPMWAMLENVVQDYDDLNDLPCSHECNWLAHYVLSSKKTEKGNPYKDLLAIQSM